MKTSSASNRSLLYTGLALLLLAMAIATNIASANVITPQNIISCGSTNGASNPTNLISAKGLIGSGDILTQTVTNDSTAATLYLSSATRSVGTNWVRFNLGTAYQSYDLTGAAIWQFNQSGGVLNGAQTIGVYAFTQTNGNNPTAIAYNLGTFTLNQGSGLNSEPAQLISFSAKNVSQIMITFSNAFNGGTITNVGLSKVRFLGQLHLLGPVSQTTVVGENLLLVSQAYDTNKFGWQWMKGGVPIVNATNSTLILTNTTTSHSGNYSVIASNALSGSTTSAVAAVSIISYSNINVITPVSAVASSTPGENNPPTPMLQDVHNLINDNGQAGSPALAEVCGADGNATGMWQDTDPSTVATNWVVFDLGASYDLSGAAIWNMNQQNLLVRAIYQLGVFVSSVPQSPLSHPASSYDCTNYVGTFTLNRGTGQSDSPVSIVSFPTLATNVVRVMLALSNCWSEFPIESAGLSEVRFLGNPRTISIATQPQSAAMYVGDPIKLTVTPAGGTPYTYQWRKNGTPISGAVAPILNYKSLQTSDAATYTVVVSNYAGAITSSPAVLAVQTPADTTSGLIGQWKLDESTGSTASDATINADNGTVYNSPPGDAQWITGQIGGAMAFNGPSTPNGSNYIVVPNYPKPITTISFSAWVWADGSNPSLNGSIIAGNYGTTNVGQFLMSIGPAGQLRVDVNQSTYNALQTVTVMEGTYLPTNSWQHVVFVADGTRVRLYRNSLQVGSAPYDGTLLVPPKTYLGQEVMFYGTNGNYITRAALITGLGIGARLPDSGTTAVANFWKGKLDDLALWGRALTPNEITEIYAAGNAGQDATQGASYPLTAPVIVQSPQSQSTYPSQNPIFTVVATGTQPFTYQWYENDTNLLSWATSGQLQLMNVQNDKSGFTYKVVVSNGGGSATSASATLSFLVSGPTTNDFTGGAYNTPYTAKVWGTAPTAVANTLPMSDRVSQTNVVVFDRTAGASGHIVATWNMYCSTGQLGASFTLLDTAYYGSTGNPFSSLAALPSNTNRWGFTNSLTIGFDTYNVYGSPAYGNEITVNWGGRGSSGPNGNGPCSQIVDGQQRIKIASTSAFSARPSTNVPVKAEITFTNGGANLSLWISSGLVLSNYFVAGIEPYEARVAFATITGTTANRALTNRITNLSVVYDQPGLHFDPPVVVQAFVQEWLQTANQAPTYNIALPPVGQSFGRVVALLSVQNPPPGGVDYYDRVGDLFTWDDNGNQVELIRFFTGYSVTWSWYVDLTEFQSLLRGNRNLQVFIGTLEPDGTPSHGYGYSVTVTLYYYPGVPSLTPYKLQNLWNATPNYGVEYGLPERPMDSEITGVPGTFSLPIKLKTDAGAQQFVWKSFVSGHGQSPNYQNAAEFLQSWRILTVSNASGNMSYSNNIWKADNFRNPAGPESGTWTGSRAGWVPMSVINENGFGGWSTNVTGAIVPGQDVTMFYRAMPWVNLTPVVGNSARYAFSSSLISYRPTLLVPTIWANSGTVFLPADTGTCQAVLPDQTLANFLIQSDVSSVTVTQSPPAGTSLALGTNIVTVTGWDTLGNSTNGTIAVVVQDMVPPVVTLLGDNPLTNECGTPFVDPGATATDDCSGIAGMTTNTVGNPNAAGSYLIQYVAVDGAGNSATNTRTVYLVDTTPPVVTLNGANPISVECHGSFSDPGATASDTCAGSLSAPASGSVDVNTPGTYTVTYTATDPSGNSATNTRTVNVGDTMPPVITYNFTNLTITADTNCQALMPDVTGTNYILAADACSASVTITQDPTNQTVLALNSTNVVVIAVADSTGHIAYSTNSVVVISSPVITVLGDSPMTNECHSGFTDPGATFMDYCSSISTTGTNGVVDANTVGVYTLEYVASDADGNSATNTRTVYVVDTTAPVVTLNGSSPMTVECHGSFSDPGATANDDCAGSLSVSVSGSVDANTVGTYTLSYSATDPSGNSATNTRTVNVADTTPPVITYNFTNLTVSADTNCQALMPDVTGTNYVLAADACSASVVITQTPTNGTVLALGTNEVVLAVADSSGNTAYSTNTVVVAYTTPPVITVLGDNPQTNECHSAFVDAGATAADNCSGVVAVSTNGVVDPNTLGVYTVQYIASDAAGNSATNTRTVYVVDTTAPVITVLGDNPMTVECHGGFNDPGATANDDCAGSLSVSVSGSVDANTVGTYTLSYSATDPSGNSVTNTRTVYVADTTPPVITYNFTNLTVSADTNCQALMPDVTGTNYVLAADACSASVVITQTPTNGTVLALGTNEVVLAVADSTGNTAYSTNTVVVTTVPVVTVLGDNPLTNECHAVFSDPGVSAVGTCSAVTSVTTNGTVNADAVGVYTLTYTATDAGGYTATTTRTVYVVDTTPPVITLNGDNPMTNYVLMPFVDPGASALDACAGEVGVVTNGTVDVATAGLYTIEYVATDAAGNSATNARTVQVLPLVNPTISAQAMMAGGKFKIVFSGPEGQSYKVIAALSLTAPLADWETVDSGTFGTSPVTFIDNDSPSHSGRYYRIVSP